MFFKKKKATQKRLDAHEWGKLYNSSIAPHLIENVLRKKYSIQTNEMLKIAEVGDSVLEIGSGTGETSIALAQNGCVVTAIDFEPECIKLLEHVANHVGALVECVCEDVESPHFLSGRKFDKVFQAGFLEHYSYDERVALLRNWSRLCKKSMISLVPNASSLAYRVGKSLQEKHGIWPYGLENPIHSMVREFSESGFVVVDEYSIGAEHALNFLPANHYLRKSIQKWLLEGDNSEYWQGYLLVTIGEKLGGI